MAFEWLNEESRKFLSRGYLIEGQTPEERIRQIADQAQKYLNIEGYADKFYEYMSRGYYSLSSPVWANYGQKRGLPVSCFGSYIEDTMDSILYGHAENGMLMKSGGGTSGYFGELRHRGAPITNSGESNGAVHFMQLFDTLANVVSQGNVRRGYFSSYLPIEHPDAEEFLDIGTEGHPIQGMTTGITVSTDFIGKMRAGDPAARKLWAKVLQRRSEVGYPYILFTDNVNNNKPQVYKDLDMKIYASNMCSEIALPSSPDETFTCVLSSINLLHWEEIKETDAIETLTYFLDTVVTEFIAKTRGDRYYERPHKFAERHRALGLGVLGWHSFLQSKMIPFEGREAAKKNLEVAKTIKERTYKASEELAKLYGEPEVLKGYGRRNTTLMAIAPTKSSSTILGQVSQSIEPEFSNYYVKDLAKTKMTVKNPFLKAYLESVYRDTDDVWESIRLADGSVQHLDFLPENIREVFKTFAEINPHSIIDQAAIRQDYIDQAQSLNLMIPADTPVKEINALYLYAHDLGVKSLYYQYGVSQAQALSRKKVMNEGCASCEG
jgi:ribonucleoside-diphosphate reductase alpha chain